MIWIRAPSVRAAGLAALFAGAALVTAEGTLLIVVDQDHWDCNSSSDLWVNALYLVSFLMLAPAVLGIHRRQDSRAGRVGAVAATVAAIGVVATGLINAAEHCLHLPIGFAFVLAALVTFVALLVFAVSMLRARVLPRWMGGVILLGTLALQFASLQGGIYVFGLAWVAVGAALLIKGGRVAGASTC